MKKLLIKILTGSIFTLSLTLSLIGVIIIAERFNSNNLESNIELKKDGTVQQQLKIDLKGFYPGKEEDYTINLLTEDLRNLEGKIDFSNSNGGELQKFILVNINSGDYEETFKLEDLLTTKNLVIFNITSDVIKIKYIMPIDVGNEAQGTGVFFDILLTVGRK